MMTRYECLRLLAPRINDELITCSVARVNPDLYHVKHREGNLYLCYMSGATPIALGLALALPHRRVISLDGDGSMLMGLGILPVIAEQDPANLIVIVFDNEAYEFSGVGSMPTPTASRTDLSRMAQGAGIQNVTPVREPAEFEEAIDNAFQAKGASVIIVKVELGGPLVPFAALDGTENKYRFIRYIEQTENIKVIMPPPRRGRK